MKDAELETVTVAGVDDDNLILSGVSFLPLVTGMITRKGIKKGKLLFLTIHVTYQVIISLLVFCIFSSFF